MIEVKNLEKTYDEFKALDNVSFNIANQGITGLLGPNGAGKTTTMKILTGFLAPTRGTVLIDGLDLKSDVDKIKYKIGYLPENNPLYQDMNVIEYLEYVADLKKVSIKDKKEQIRKVINDCGLQEKLYQDISKLSKGYRQRVGLAQSLLGNPDILILDEPTVGLDPNQIVEIRELIKKIGKEKMVILSSHILAEVEATCDNVIIINKGKIVASGTANELKSQASGQTKITLVVEKGYQGNIIELIKSFEGVVDIVLQNSTENEEKYEITTKSEVDLRRNIIRNLADNSINLLEISRREMKLEDVFSHLTK